MGGVKPTSISHSGEERLLLGLGYRTTSVHVAWSVKHTLVTPPPRAIDFDCLHLHRSTERYLYIERFS